MNNYFISSTFRDMQTERDMMNARVLPYLKKIANGYGEDFSFIDLRCGIDTENMDEQQETKRILSVCMTKIEECQAHFIILLGDRYGSVPTQNALNAFLASEQGKDFRREESVEKSVTELEIIHALTHFAQKKEIDYSEYLTVCIREPLPYEKMSVEDQQIFQSQTDDERKKLQELKQWLITAYPDTVLSYHADWDSNKHRVKSLETFCSALIERLENQLRKQHLYHTEISNEGQQFLCDKNFQHIKADTFVDFGELFEKHIHMLRDSSIHTIILHGMHGSGKSSLVAALATAEEKQYKVISLFCGNGEFLSTSFDVLKNLVWRLERLLDKPHYNERIEQSFAELKWHMEKLFEEAACQYKLLIVVDGLDVLQDDEHFRRFDFLPINSNHDSKIILTTAELSSIPQHIVTKNTSVISPVNFMEVGDVIPIAQSIYQHMNKELPVSLKNRIVSVAAYHSPLYLSLLITRLNLLTQDDYYKISQIENTANGGQQINQYLARLTDQVPQTEQELANDILRISEKMFSGKLAKWITFILQIMKKGCSLNDIVNICNYYDSYEKVTLLDVSIFIQGAGEIFRTDSNGWITFCHGLMPGRDVMDPSFDVFQNAVFSYLDTLQVEDPIKLQYFLSKCFYQRDSHIAARYLSEVYGKYAENLFQERKNDNMQIVNAAILSLYDLYKECNSADITKFIISMIASVQDSSPQEINNLCSCFLFTYDLLFGEMLNVENRNAVMDALYKVCSEKLYQYAKTELMSSSDDADQAVLWMRTVYVCCEQRGIRTNDGELRTEMYQEFHKINHEVLCMLSSEYQWYEYIVADGAISYCKLATLPQLGWKRSANYCTCAMQLIEQCVPDYKNSPSLLLEHLRSAYQRAEIYIQEANQKKKIGWPAGEMDEYLEDALHSIDEMEEYYKAHPNMKNCHYYLTRLLVLRTEMCRAKTENVPDELLSYINRILQYASAWYNETGEWRAIEHIRNAHFRLAYDSSLPLTDEQRRESIAKSFEALQYVEKHTEDATVKKIRMYTLQVLVHLYYEKIKELSKEQLLPIAEACHYVLSCTEGYLEELFSGEKGEQGYHELMWLANKELECFQQLRKLCIQCLNNSHFSNAIHYGEEAGKSLRAIKSLQTESQWLSLQIDFSELMYVVYHNRDVQIMGERFGKADFHMQSKYTSDCLYYLLRYESRYGAFSSLSYNIKKFQDYNMYMDSVSWIRFAADCLKEEKEVERFWKMADKKQRFIPGQRSAFFYVFLNYPNEVVWDWKTVIGNYICNHLSDARVLELLVNSDIMEAISMEYAYKNSMYSAAHQILLNGYCNYLELPLLVLIRKYDRKEFKKRIADLRPECFRHIKEEIRINRKYINADYLLDDILRNMHTIESKKMQELRSTHIPADIREMYVVLQPVCLQHMTKTAWMLYGILENRIYFLRCGFVEETTDKYQLQEIIRAEVPNFIDKIIWVYEDFQKFMLQNTFSSGNQSQVRLIKKMCGMTRKVAKKFEALKNSQIETQDFQELDILTAASHHFAYTNQHFNRWDSQRVDIQLKENEKWAMLILKD